MPGVRGGRGCTGVGWALNGGGLRSGGVCKLHPCESYAAQRSAGGDVHTSPMYFCTLCVGQAGWHADHGVGLVACSYTCHPGPAWPLAGQGRARHNVPARTCMAQLHRRVPPLLGGSGIGAAQTPDSSAHVPHARAHASCHHVAPSAACTVIMRTAEHPSISTTPGVPYSGAVWPLPRPRRHFFSCAAACLCSHHPTRTGGGGGCERGASTVEPAAAWCCWACAHGGTGPTTSNAAAAGRPDTCPADCLPACLPACAGPLLDPSCLPPFTGTTSGHTPSVAAPGPAAATTGACP
jgi:hypothetical protein